MQNRFISHGGQEVGDDYINKFKIFREWFLFQNIILVDHYAMTLKK